MLQGTHNYLGQHCLGKEDRTNIIFKNYFRSIRNIFGKKLAYSVMNRKKMILFLFKLLNGMLHSLVYH